jgi:quinoprotein glucose dehydrogenase
LVFIPTTAARPDYYIETRELLWQDALPAGGQATPMTYAHQGRQYVLIAAGSHGRMGNQLGDAVVAYALPRGA